MGHCPYMMLVGALKKILQLFGQSPLAELAMNVTNGITPTGPPYYGNVVGPASDTAAQGPYRRVDLPGPPEIYTYLHVQKS